MTLQARSYSVTIKSKAGALGLYLYRSYRISHGL